jgi:Transposase DDE domain group 1
VSTIRIKEVNSVLSARAGLVAINRLMRHHAQLPQLLDPQFPVKTGFADSTVALSYIGLLSQGVTHFDGVEAMRADTSFIQALGGPLPSSPTLRQRIEQRASHWLDPLFEANARLLCRTKVRPVPMACGHVPLDFDTFVMHNSDCKKEGVGFTYTKVVGYAPIAAYLGNEGYLLELALREGTQHSAKETEYTLERVLPLARRVTPAPLLVRADSGFDSAKLYDELYAHRRREALNGGTLDWIIKWNPRSFDLAAAHAARLANADTVWHSVRDGLQTTTYRESLGNDQYRVLKLSVETINRNGQSLLIPKLRVEGWQTTLAKASDAEVIELYADHGTHEQFHSELKSDMNLERLPSGKFAANDAVCALAMLAYNALRIIGQQALTGSDSPIKNHAERRRIKTVIRELIDAPARWIKSGRQWCLGLSTQWSGLAVFKQLIAWLNLDADAVQT